MYISFSYKLANMTLKIQTFVYIVYEYEMMFAHLLTIT